MLRKCLYITFSIITVILVCTFMSRAGNTYKIYFSSDRDGDFDIYSGVYPGGEEPENLTHDNHNMDTEPGVSRDGKKLVYSAYLSDGKSQIFTMNVDGTNKRQLTSSGHNRMPAFSYDGKKIVFISTRDLNEEVYIMNSDGTSQVRLTFGKAIKEPPSYDKPMPPEVEVTRDRDPVFSPDGKKIVWTSYRDGNADLFIMDIKGKNAVHLTDTKKHYHNIQPVFSPDGKNIVWASDRDGDYDLFTMKVSSDINHLQKAQHLTYDGFGSHFPKFSKDGKKIVFGSNLQGPDWEMYIMDSNGKNIETLFPGSGDDWFPCIN